MYTIDASVWVNGFDRREPGHVTSRQLLELLRVQGLPIIEPMLVLAEVAGAISRTRQDPARAQAFATALGQLPNVTVVPCDTVLGQRALELAAQHGLRGADAMYAAVTRHAACTLISLDNEHLTRLTDIVRVQTPEDTLAELSPPPEEAPPSCPSC